MGTALNESAWSTTPASNDGADSTIGTVANTSSPTNVDDWIKGIMAARAKARLDRGGALVAGGTSTALTVTTNQSLSSSHIANGLNIKVRTASAATGAATIAIDGLTAVDIKTNGLAAVASGDWASGAILDLVYSSAATAFIIQNIGPASGFNITSLTAETALDHAADYVPVYDASATANRKMLPRYFAPSVRASFFAYPATNQSVASASNTKVTLGTELFDIGSCFSSSTWTPPAGTVRLTASLSGTGMTSGERVTVYIYKNGSSYRRSGAVADSTGSWAVQCNVIDQCNGTDTYEVYVQSVADTSYTVVVGPEVSYFCGHMI